MECKNCEKGLIKKYGVIQHGQDKEINVFDNTFCLNPQPKEVKP